MFNLINAIWNGSRPTDRQWVEFKSSLFGLTDNKIREKVAFAFFLDKAKQETTRLFPDLQFCAGSLTEDLFAKTLRQLLETKPPLSVSTLQVIQNYLSAIKETENFNFFVDESRSQNLFLALLAKTGSTFLAHNYITFYSKDSAVIDQFVEKINQEVQSLTVGEKRLFLLGSLIHDTRLYVERCDANTFLFAYFDPADPSTLEYSYWIDSNKASGSAFWRPICETKFERHLSKGGITRHLMAYGNKEKNSQTALIKAQKQNSCHFRSILGLFKWQLYSACAINKIDFEVEWIGFKMLFGATLLAGLSTNPTLQEYAQKKALVLQKKSDLQRKIQEAKKDKQLEMATLEDLKKLLSQFVFFGENIEMGLEEENAPLAVEPLAEICRQLVKKSAASLEPFSALFMNSPVAKAIFDLHVVESEKDSLLFTKESCKERSFFLPAVKTLFQNVPEEKWHFQVASYLEYLNQHRDTPYRKLFCIALNHMLSGAASFLQTFPEDPNLLLSDSSWLSIASTCSHSSENSLTKMAVQIAITIFEKNYRKNPDCHFAKGLERLTCGFEDNVRFWATLTLWFYGYQKGLFHQISTLSISHSGAIYTGHIRSPFTTQNYFEARSLLINEKLPFDLKALCFRDLVNLAFQEQNASLFFDLFLPQCKKIGFVNAKAYLCKVSNDSVQFLLEKAFETAIENHIIAIFLRQIVDGGFFDAVDRSSETIDRIVKAAIERRFYGSTLSIQRFKLFGDQYSVLPENCWTKQFLTMIDFLEELIRPKTTGAVSVDRWAAIASVFAALPEAVKSDLIQALYAEASDGEKLSVQLKELHIRS